MVKNTYIYVLYVNFETDDFRVKLSRINQPLNLRISMLPEDLADSLSEGNIYMVNMQKPKNDWKLVVYQGENRKYERACIL